MSIDLLGLALRWTMDTPSLPLRAGSPGRRHPQSSREIQLRSIHEREMREC